MLFRVTSKTVVTEDDKPSMATVQLIHDSAESSTAWLTLTLPNALASEYTKGAKFDLGKAGEVR